MVFDNTGAKIRICLFGGFRIEGQCAGLTGRKAAAIIAYLARSPGMSAPREKLAYLFWSDSDSDHSRNSLRQTLSVLRRDLLRDDLDIIDCRRDMISLKPDAVSVDVDAFETSLANRTQRDLEAALAQYSGPFLEGFYVGSNPFDDWVASERERLLNRALESFEVLARLAGKAEGLVIADRLLAMEPTREATYRLKIELLAQSGQNDRAMRTFDVCEAMLKKEFGVGVSPETAALWEIIRPNGKSLASIQSSYNGVASAHPARTSISVEGFANLTGERGDDYFALGLVQDITTVLSGISDYIILSGNGRAGDWGLRARYLLTGSVQRSSDQLRVNIQLSDTVDGHNVWAQKFDGRFENLLEFQDRIAQAVVLAITLQLQFSHWTVRDKSPPGGPEVRRLVNAALMKYFEMTRRSLSDSKDLCEQALAIEPDNARAKRTLSVAITMGMAFGGLAVERQHIERALQLAQAAVRAVPDDEVARVILSFAFLYAGRIEEAIAECLHAISLNPNYPSARGDLAELYGLSGRVPEALHEANEGIRLSDRDVIDFWRHNSMALALFAGGDDQAALDAARKVVRKKPGFVRGALYWAAAAAATGNSEEASRAIHHCLSQMPHLNLDNVSPGFVPRYVRDSDHARFLNMLAKAGLPRP